MAKFTAAVPLNIEWFGNQISGAAGATHRIPDALADEWAAGPGSLVPGFSWVVQDETTDFTSAAQLALKYDKTGGTISGSTTVTGTLTAGSVIAAAVTATTARFKGSPWFDAKAYGALGDGVTDDTAALVVAINAATAAGGGIVYLPIGTYLVSAALNLATNIGLLGSGPLSILQQKASTAANNTAIVKIPENAQNVLVRDLVLDGNYANQSGTPTSLCLDMANTQGLTSDIRIQNCRMKNSGNQALVIRGKRVSVEGCTFDGNRFGGVYVTFDVATATSTTTGKVTETIRIANCAAIDNNADSLAGGFAVVGPAKSGWGTLVRDVTFTGCIASGNGASAAFGGYGFRATSDTLLGSEVIPNTNTVGITNITWVGCVARANNDTGWWLHGVKGFTVAGCVIDGNQGGTGAKQSGPGIELQGVYDGTITGCVIRNTGGEGLRIWSADATSAYTYGVPTRDITVSDTIIDGCGVDPLGTATTQLYIRQIVDSVAVSSIKFSNCIFRNGQMEGAVVEVASDVEFTGCTFEDNGLLATASRQCGIAVNGNSTHNATSRILITGCKFRDTGGTKQLVGIQDNGVNVTACAVSGSTFINLTPFSVLKAGWGIALLPNVVDAGSLGGAGNTNNYAPTGLATATVIRISATTTGRNLTGIVAQPGGKPILLQNSGSFTITITHFDSGNSAVANVFNNPAAASISLRSGGSLLIVYDAVGTFWVPVVA